MNTNIKCINFWPTVRVMSVFILLSLSSSMFNFSFLVFIFYFSLIPYLSSSPVNRPPSYQSADSGRLKGESPLQVPWKDDIIIIIKSSTIIQKSNYLKNYLHSKGQMFKCLDWFISLFQTWQKIYTEFSDDNIVKLKLEDFGVICGLKNLP